VFAFQPRAAAAWRSAAGRPAAGHLAAGRRAGAGRQVPASVCARDCKAAVVRHQPSMRFRCKSAKTTSETRHPP